MRAALLALLVACGHPGTPAESSQRSSAGGGDPKACAADADCTLVEACCGCGSGGRRVAIRRDAVAAHDADRAKVCEGSTCNFGESAHSSCDAEAVCRDGKCAVQPHLGGH